MLTGMNKPNKAKAPRIVTDGPTFQSYAFPTTSSSTSNGPVETGSPSVGWFGELRAKLSQLGALTEWMSQLGLRDDEKMAASSSTDSGVETSSDQMFDYDESTLLFRPVVLDESTDGGATSSNVDQEDDGQNGDNWDFGATFLADLDSSHVWNDTLDRQHFGPLRDLITTGGTRKAVRHNFVLFNILHPTWCDKCGDFIWGILRQAARCETCNYTCHERCRDLVTLECRSPGSSMGSDNFEPMYPQLDGTLGTIPKGLLLPSSSMSSSQGSDKENGEAKIVNAENPLFSPSKSFNSFTLPKSFSPVDPKRCSEPVMPSAPTANSTLRVVERYVKEDTPFEWTSEYKESGLTKKIDAYNEVARGMTITMRDDGETFEGHVQVHMNLTRPINVVQGVAPPSVYDLAGTGKSTARSSTMRTITSFFLPRNTVKTINISSKTTTRHMIVTLLRKFHVADNPRKFALYECEQQLGDECTLMRKMSRISDDVCPLKVVLNWESPHCGKSLVLQENDTGDILYDAFEVPELENFLRILAMEEKQYLWQTQQKYSQYRCRLNAELRSRGYVVEDEPADNPLIALDETNYMPRGLSTEFGTSDSMVVSGMMTAPEAEYVNLEFLRQKQMEESTRL